jgi:hypothetical protein
MRFLCRVRVFVLGYERGHRWQSVFEDDRAISVAQVCLRCRENGWLIREH